MQANDYCQEGERLLGEAMESPEEVSSEKVKAFAEHVQSCSQCAATLGERLKKLAEAIRAK